MAIESSEILSSQYNQIANEFSSYAEIYGSLSRQAFYSVLDFDFTKLRLLDAACGDGYDLQEYQQRGASVYGLDASEEFINRINTRLKDAHLSVGLMENMPYLDNFFDVVVSKYALQVSEDVSKVISEITRVLKPGGILAYLAVHPFRHFIEKNTLGKDYFLQEIVESNLFNKQVTVYEPSHTLQEYLSPYFFANYRLVHFEEKADFASSEKINADNYPGFFIVRAEKLPVS